MLELLLCSLLTILPDYLYRRYVQGRRLGKEITFYSVWFELRWGISACLILTVSLITVIFYNHPSTSNVTLFFRTVPILPETNGRVAEIFVGISGTDRQGRADLQAGQFEAGGRGRDRPAQDCRGRGANGRCASRYRKGRRSAQGSRERRTSRPWTNWRPSRSCTSAIRATFPSAKSKDCRSVLREISPQSLPRLPRSRAPRIRIATLLPAEKASAEAALDQAQVELDKTVVRAGVSGRVEQFLLRVGDVVNPLMRPAGILIPEGAGQRSLQAGFGQIEAQIMKVGMVG